MKVWVLRLGHRRGRDPRLTTHVALTARALGCNGIILSGEKDDSIIENINEIVKNWGSFWGEIWKKLEEDRHKLNGILTRLTQQKKKIGKLAKKYEKQLKRVSADQSKRKKILVQIRNQKSMELAAIETLKNSAKELDR